MTKTGAGNSSENEWEKTVSGLYTAFKDYHDVLLFVLQLAIIGPLVATFIDIGAQRRQLDLRNAVILDLNSQIFNMLGDMTMAYQHLNFLEVKETMVELLEVAKEGYESGRHLLPEEGQASLEADIAAHNQLVAQRIMEQQGSFETSKYRFRRALRSANQIKSSLMVWVNIIHRGDDLYLLRLIDHTHTIAEVAEAFYWFIDMRVKGLNAEAPPTVNTMQVIDLWETYLRSRGTIIGRYNLRSRTRDLIARLFFGGPVLDDLPADQKEKLLKLIPTMRRIENFSTERQSGLIKILLTADLNSHLRAIIPPKSET